MPYLKYLFAILLCCNLPLAQAGTAETVFRHSVNKPVTTVYDALYKALEDRGYYVIFEPDIGKNLSHFAGKWGEDYNRNKLESIRSMVFCKGWYANLVGNADPTMLALCPMHLTLIAKDGQTTVLFVRPTVIGAASPALDILQRVETEVTEAIKHAMSAD